MTAIVGNKNLPALVQAAHDTIDLAAEAARLQFVTAGSAQAMVYIQKAMEANAFLAKYPDSTAAPTASDPNDWPWISAELGVTAPTMWQVAEVISQLASQFVGVGSAIEALRMSAKANVDAAKTPAQVAAAQVITWPLPPSNLPST